MASRSHMSDERVIRSGRHKGKRIVMASTSGLSRVREESERFMREIFEMERESYLITDESSLYDFLGVDGEHQRLSECRVNTVTLRREFFRATPLEVKTHLTELAGELL